MLLLRATTDDLQIVTDAAGDIEVHLSAMVADSASPPALKAIPALGALPSITTATTTTIIDSSAISGIASGDSVNVEHCNLRNNHASQAVTTTVRVIDGTDTVDLMKVILLAGESLVLSEGGVWLHYDSNGGLYPSVGNKASQAEAEAGTADDRFLTPLSVNWHPGSTKCWGKAVGAGTSLTVNWNTAGITDTGTGRLGVTIGTDFSSANYSICATIERDQTSLSVANVAQCEVRNASPAAGSFEIESYDHTAITLAAQDPSSYFWSCHGDQA